MKKWKPAGPSGRGSSSIGHHGPEQRLQAVATSTNQRRRVRGSVPVQNYTGEVAFGMGGMERAAQTKRPGRIGPGLQGCTSTSVIIGSGRWLRRGSRAARYQGLAVHGRTSPRGGGLPLCVSARFEARPEYRSGTFLVLTVAAERNASARAVLPQSLPLRERS